LSQFKKNDKGTSLRNYTSTKFAGITHKRKIKEEEEKTYVFSGSRELLVHYAAVRERWPSRCGGVRGGSGGGELKIA